MPTNKRVSVAGLVALAVLVSAPAAGASTYAVDATADAVDAQPGDGICRAATGACTLRAAVQEANAGGGTDVVVLPAGRFTLSRPPQLRLPGAAADLEIDAANGDLDLLGSVAIRGAGADRTTIDGARLDRVFSSKPLMTVTIADLTITGGDASAGAVAGDIALGGAILNQWAMTLERVALVANRASGGGGIFNTPRSTPVIRDSLIANNIAVEGGGVRVDSGALIVNTTITGNRLESQPLGALLPDEITGYGGGIDHRGGADLTIINSTITNNHAFKAGGGLNSGQDYAPVVPAPLWPFRVHLRNTIIAGNTATRPGDCHVSAMVIESLGHNLAGDDSCFLTAPGDLPRRDPQLGALADNGGPTQTLALRAGSPAIDAASAQDCPKADQRGVARPQGSGCDVGAVEYQAPRCRAPRYFTIHLPRAWRSARVTLAGKRLRVTRRKGRLVATVDLRGKSGRVKLVARGRTRSGRAVRQVRTYRVTACS